MRASGTRRLRAVSAVAAALVVLLVGTVAGASASASASTATAAAVPATAVASSTASGVDASALVDGDVDRAQTGAEWRPADDDTSPWVKLSWRSARQVASVQIYGPSQAPADASQWATAPLHGKLTFSDGSSVVVSGIAAGDGQPTTIAFAPRMADSVKLSLTRGVSSAVVGLREVAVFAAGTTPPRWPVSGPTYTVTPPVARCSGSSASVAATMKGQLTLACPTPGSAVSGKATVIVNAPAGAQLRATAWKPSSAGSRGSASAGSRSPSAGAGSTAGSTGWSGAGAMVTVATATAGSDGRASLTVSTDSLPHGPLTVKVTQVAGPAPLAAPVSVQLMNTGGTKSSSAGYAPAGMTLQWDEEFNRPLSVSSTGLDATYSATKPAYSGGGSFGDAVFADPAQGADTVATEDGYLRLRVAPIAGTGVSATWGQAHVGGILASAAVGGSGFAAQYGYFEARMMGAPGAGTWPAFWGLNTQSTTSDDHTAGEADAVELYGHNPLGSCHSTHAWGVTTPGQGGQAACLAKNGAADWTMAWHTYGMRVTPNGATFSIDGVKVATDTGLARTDEPYFFLVNLALGGGWPVNLAATGDISDLYVDWIHVYT